MAWSSDTYWLALRRVRGVGPRVARLLLENFAQPERIFALAEDEIVSAGVPRHVARNIREFEDFEPLEKELCELPRIEARLIRWSDDDYPVNLRQIADPPPYLFARGTIFPQEANCVAIVGARAASDAGRRMAQRLGLELAAKGFTVVSGLARGIDGEAHQGALDSGGRTIAVLGSGIDVIYPPEHRKLAETIISDGGAILSELPIGTAPIGENFPSRNRILSGLCLGVVVVEAAEKSGSLITARIALDQNRQVFAVPGSPLTGKTRGSNRLLKQGAKLVECVEDVVEELVPQLANPPVRSVELLERGKAQAKWDVANQSNSTRVLQTDNQNAEIVLNCLKGGERLHVDSVIEISGLSAQEVLRLLLELELRGAVAQHPGKLFSLA